MICNKCNQSLPDDSEFCQYCGAKIEIAKKGEEQAECAGEIVIAAEAEVAEKTGETQMEEVPVLEAESETIEESSNKENVASEVVSNGETLLAETSGEKSKRVRYCKMCGGLIDFETKKCTSCGKQFFKLPKIKLTKTKVLVSVCIMLLAFNVFQGILLVQKNTEITRQERTLEIEGKSNVLEASIKTKAKFMDKYIVLVNGEDKIYHKFGCSKIKRLFRAYNVATARELGYSACGKCA